MAIKANADNVRLTASAVKREAGALRDPERARFLQGYFRMSPGGYGEGDRMLGLTVPQQRIIARAFRSLPAIEIQKLLSSTTHEHRLIGLLIMVDQHGRAGNEDKLALHRLYLENLSTVNNWDIVDSSAAALIGAHRVGNAKLLKSLVAATNVWHRRIAIVSTFAELRAGQTGLTFKLAEQLLSDKHDLVRKAVGWLLREAGKLSQEELLVFLRTHYAHLPRTTLRYAIERLDPVDRKAWLSGRSKATELNQSLSAKRTAVREVPRST